MNAPTSNGKLGVFFCARATFEAMAENMHSESLNSLLRELALSLKKLTNDETSLRELDETLNIARELHERIAILRFRAIEELGKQGEEKDEGVDAEERGFERPFAFSIQADGPSKPSVEAAEATEAAEAEPRVTSHPEQIEDVPPAIEAADAPTPERIVTDVEMGAMSLADRLQLAPLAHLTDAMGINDRVRYAQELFGGDMGAFKSACSAIESAASENEAIEMAHSMADSEVDWTVEKGAAADFAVLVSRLYVGKPA